MVLEKKKVMYLMRKFVNHIMIDGKKRKAERVFEKSLFFVKLKERQNPVVIFFKALNLSKPFVEVRSVRRGGATYQIPVPLKEKRAISLSMKWILQAAKKKKGILSLNLANILVEASKNQGDSVKKKESIHLTALKNRSLTHFRWF
uniref:Ribosomal protein S7 n=1 Tax=Trachydiscus minutus TaxID=1032745 RepID=A0A140F2R5_9STRA|nr:ribosomal protein S7 [Trachydiscus minutus]AML60699.1 ribosomal protein S7 [Trachydiscus minutus]